MVTRRPPEVPDRRWTGYRPVADYHTHTVHSHGRGTVLANARVAAARGLETIAITDHGPQAVPWVAVDSRRTFDRIRREAAHASEETGVTVLTGAECNVMTPDGDLDLPARDLARLDLVVAGLHLMILPDDPRRLRQAARLVMPNLAPWKWSQRNRARVRVDNTKALVEAVNKHRLAFVTHPGLHLPVDTPELARACARRGTRMEISTAHHETGVAYVKAAARLGVDFVLSSDAHRPERVGDLSLAMRIAERAGLDPARVWNVAKAGPAMDDAAGPADTADASDAPDPREDRPAATPPPWRRLPWPPGDWSPGDWSPGDRSPQDAPKPPPIH